MNGVLFTFPDEVSPDALPEWLDWHLVTPGLGQLVAELTAVHGRPVQTTPLETVLAGFRQQVLDAGLRELPRAALSKLLKPKKSEEEQPQDPPEDQPETPAEDGTEDPEKSEKS